MTEHKSTDKYTPTELKVNRLFHYLFKIEADSLIVNLNLSKDPSFKKSALYKKVGDFRKHISTYIDRLRAYKDISSLVGAKSFLKDTDKFLGGEAYEVTSELKKYGTSRFRSKNWKDEDTEVLERTKYLPTDVKTAKEIVDEFYDMHDVEPELKEKIEKAKPKIRPETKLLAVVVAISLGFGAYRLLEDPEISRAIGIPTASYILPTAQIVSANFEIIYVLVSVFVLSVYIIGKMTKKW